MTRKDWIDGREHFYQWGLEFDGKRHFVRNVYPLGVTPPEEHEAKALTLLQARHSSGGKGFAGTI